MANVYFSSSSTAGTNITLASGDDAYIGPEATRASMTGVAISATGTGHDIVNMGHLFGSSAGILLGNVAATSNQLTIGAGASMTGGTLALDSAGLRTRIVNAGFVSGQGGIEHRGNEFFLVNSGTITATMDAAVFVDGRQGEIVNTGLITGGEGSSGIVLDCSAVIGSSTATVINHGTIRGDVLGVFGAPEDSNRIENHGWIDGIGLGALPDVVINTGLINRDVQMGGGSDIYLAFDEGRVRGAIHGGTGNDTLTGGDRRDQIEGGDDRDMLRGGGGVDRVSGGAGDDTLHAEDDGARDYFDGGEGNDQLRFTDIAEGLKIRAASGVVRSESLGADRFEGFEIIAGGRGNDRIFAGGTVTTLQGGAGDDRLTGTSADERLQGDSDDDILAGRGGADVFDGGTGNDRLTGGGGSDLFLFFDGWGRDVITDFDATDNAEKIDLSLVAGITGIADLRADHMSQHGADVWIEDGADRIVLVGVAMADLHNADFVF